MNETLSNNGQANEITDALNELYNRTSRDEVMMSPPPDPWASPCEDEDCAGKAMDEAYN